MPDAPVFDAHIDGQGAVALSGEIDIMSVAALRRTLVAAVERGAGPFVVDLSAVEFLDAAGLGVLVDVANKAAAAGRRLVVTRPSAMVGRVMAILGPEWPLETL